MLRFSKASIELYERTGGREICWGSEWEGKIATKKSGNSAVEFQSRYYLQRAVAGYSEDSRFSAISSILVTEFQLRPVPGVFRVL